MRERIQHALISDPNDKSLTGDYAVAGVPRDDILTKPAAVLVPLIERPAGIQILLTRRTGHLANHASQISFPGGKQEECDENAIATALRESQEEIGLRPEQVEVAGYLDLYQTVTGFLVRPVVGFVQLPIELKLDPNEVSEAFEMPLDYILDPENHHRHKRAFNNTLRPYFILPHGGRYLWGATAAMLINFQKRIAAADSL